MSKGGGKQETRQWTDTSGSRTQQGSTRLPGFQMPLINEAIDRFDDRAGMLGSDYQRAQQEALNIARGGGGVNQGFNTLFQAANPTAALGTLGNIASGQYLNNNPYVDQMFNQAARQVGEQFQNYVVPGISGNASMAGRLGSPAYARSRNRADETFGRTLSELATDIYGQNYARERGFQNQAAMGLADYGQGILGQQGGLQLNALRSVQDPINAYADLVFRNLGQDTTSQGTYEETGSTISQRPQQKKSILGTLGNLALGIGSMAVPGGGSLGGSLLSGGGSALPAVGMGKLY